MTNSVADPPEGQVSATVDYATFSFPDGTDWHDVAKLLRLRETTALPAGRYGYRSAEAQGHVTILHAGGQGMGVCVEVSGKGCRELEASGRVEDWPAFVREVIGCGGKFSRIDFAFDDRQGLLNLDVIEGALREGQVSTRFRVWEPRSGKQAIGGGAAAQRQGRTVYIGSRQSDSYFRIYDKAKEQGIIDGSHWIRFEVECKGNTVQALSALFAEQGMSVIAGYIRGLLEFKLAGADTVRSRWKVAGWWISFLEHAEKVRLRISKAVQTLESIKQWLRKQVAPTLAMMVLINDGNYWEVMDLVDAGKQRVKPWRLAQLQGV